MIELGIAYLVLAFTTMLVLGLYDCKFGDASLLGTLWPITWVAILRVVLRDFVERKRVR